VIAERIRRLPDGYRRLLEAASIEGEIFTAEVAARLVNMSDDEVRQQLFTAISRHMRLVKAESIQRIGSRRLSRFRFRHILYQKYIYRHLDLVERRGLHQKVAETLEAFFMESESQKQELSSQMIRQQAQLAWHCEQAGLPELAVEYLLLAGNGAVQMSANTEAVSLYMHALSLLKSLPESQERDQKELDLQLALTVPLIGIYGWGTPERAHTYNRVIELSQRIDSNLNKDQIFRTLTALAFHYLSTGEVSQAVELGERLLSLSRQIQDPAAKVMAYCILGLSYFYQGMYRRAFDHLEQAWASYEEGRLRPWMAISGFEPGILIRGFQAVVWWALGYPERAWQAGQDVLSQAQVLNHPLSLNFVAVHIITSLTVIIHGSLRGVHWPEMLSQQGAEEQFQAERDLAFFRHYAAALQGFVQVEQGEVEEGIALMYRNIAEVRLIGIQIGRPILHYLLAIAHLKANLLEQGLAIVEDIISLLEKSGSHHFTAGFYHLKGEFLLGRLWATAGNRGLQNNTQSFAQEAEEYLRVENYFLKAVEVARQQEAKSWELQATISLARLWQRQGKVEQAQQVLGEIYGWFREGFDMPDLVRARELLGELAAAKPRKN
jgi:tetratricopeptide (TPR) repeat protein